MTDRWKKFAFEVMGSECVPEVNVEYEEEEYETEIQSAAANKTDDTASNRHEKETIAKKKNQKPW